MNHTRIHASAEAALFVFFSLFVVSLPLSIAFAEIFLGISLLIWFYKAVTGDYRRIHMTITDIFILFITVIWILSSVVNGSIFEGLDEIRSLWLVSAFYIAYYAIKKDKTERLIIFLGFSASTSAFVGIMQYYMNPMLPRFLQSEFLKRPQGFFSHSLTFGGFYLMLYCVFLSRALYDDNKSKIILSRVFSFLFGTVCLLSRGRSVWLGFFAATLLICSFRSWKTAAAGMLVIFTVALGLYSFDDRVKSRLDDIFQVEMDGTTSIGSRLIIWKEAAAVSLENPLLGIGPGNFKAELKRRTESIELKSRAHAHSNFLQIAAESGFIGLFVFTAFWIIFIGRCFVSLSKKSDHVKMGSFSAIVAFLIMGIFEYNFGDSEIAMLVWLLLGLLTHDGMLTCGRKTPEQDRIRF